MSFKKYIAYRLFHPSLKQFLLDRQELLFINMKQRKNSFWKEFANGTS